MILTCASSYSPHPLTIPQSHRQIAPSLIDDVQARSQAIKYGRVLGAVGSDLIRAPSTIHQLSSWMFKGTGISRVA